MRSKRTRNHNRALKRQAVWDAKTVGEKIAALDIRLGLNAGAVKQRGILKVELLALASLSAVL